MKYLKIFLIVLTLLAILLMTSSPASAKVTRIYYKYTGGADCMGSAWARQSGPNFHFYGTYTCRNEATLMDGVTPFPMRTGVFTWYDCQDQWVAGHDNYSCKTVMFTDEGGVWDGSFVWTANGMFKSVQQGYGIYEGMRNYDDSLPAEGITQGYVVINP